MSAAGGDHNLGDGAGRTGAPLDAGDANVSDRHPVELLAAEFTERLRRGEGPTVGEYAEKHPEWAEEIRDIFPAIATVEGYKAARQSSSGGRASLGGARLERLGDYRILREVGRGGMGVVFEAVQESLERRVAVKVLPRQSLLDAVHLRRFQREARTAARLHHTNIVPVFGVGSQDGFHYYVMQFIDGVGLDRILRELRRRYGDGGSGREGGAGSPSDRSTLAAETTCRVLEGRLQPGGVEGVDVPVTTGKENGSDSEERPAVPTSSGVNARARPIGRRYWRSVARIGVQAADAVRYAHSQGVLHRDIKPANLLVDSTGFVWVTDFGLAKAIEHDAVSKTGDVVGTLRYIAPEQLAGHADPRSDTYSLGLTLYELLTLRPAYEDTHRSRLIRTITESDPVPPRKVRGDVPRDLETIVMKAVAREPDHRYRSADELASDLRAYLEDRPIRARRTHAVTRLWRWARRNRATAISTAAAVVLLVLVAVVSVVGSVSTRAAMDEESVQRSKAEATSELAREALEKIFNRFAPNRATAASDLTIEDSEGEEFEVPVAPVLSKEAAVLLEQLLEFYRELEELGGGDPELREKTAQASRRVGDIHQRLGQLTEARAAYERALGLYGALRDGAGGADGAGTYLIEMARIHNELGNVSFADGEPGYPSHQEALRLLESVEGAAAASPQRRFESARTRYFLGRSPVPVVDLEGRGPPGRRATPGGARRGLGPPGPPRFRVSPRERHLEAAIRLLDGLVEEYPREPEYRALLARCYRDLSPGGFAAPGAEPETSPQDRAVDILRQLVEDFPDVPDYRFDLSETYAATGPLFTPRGLRNAAEDRVETADAQFLGVRERLTEALRISSELVAEHPNVPDYVTSQVRIRKKLAAVEGFVGNGDGALTMLETAASLQHALLDRFPSVVSYRVLLAIVWGDLARLQAKRGALAEAVSVLEKSVELVGDLSEEQQNQPHVWGLRRMLHRMLVDLLRKAGREKDADRTAEKLRGFEGSPPLRRGMRRGARRGAP